METLTLFCSKTTVIHILQQVSQHATKVIVGNFAVRKGDLPLSAHTVHLQQRFIIIQQCIDRRVPAPCSDLILRQIRNKTLKIVFQCLHIVLFRQSQHRDGRLSKIMPYPGRFFYVCLLGNILMLLHLHKLYPLSLIQALNQFHRHKVKTHVDDQHQQKHTA